MRRRDRHTDKQTGSSLNQGWGPGPCSGGSGDYMLWSARGPYWGTCRASVNPRFQIKVTGGGKITESLPLPLPSPFQVKSFISVWCSQKVSPNRPFSLHHLWQYIQSLLPFDQPYLSHIVMSHSLMSHTAHRSRVAGQLSLSVNDTECFHWRVGSVRAGWGGTEVSDWLYRLVTRWEGSMGGSSGDESDSSLLPDTMYPSLPPRPMW